MIPNKEARFFYGPRCTLCALYTTVTVIVDFSAL